MSLVGTGKCGDAERRDQYELFDLARSVLTHHVLIPGHTESRRVEMLRERVESMFVVLDVVDVVV